MPLRLDYGRTWALNERILIKLRGLEELKLRIDFLGNSIKIEVKQEYWNLSFWAKSAPKLRPSVQYSMSYILRIGTFLFQKKRMSFWYFRTLEELL